jgi:hypothetical protein
MPRAHKGAQVIDTCPFASLHVGLTQELGSVGTTQAHVGFAVHAVGAGTHESKSGGDDPASEPRCWKTQESDGPQMWLPQPNAPPSPPPSAHAPAQCTWKLTHEQTWSATQHSRFPWSTA